MTSNESNTSSKYNRICLYLTGYGSFREKRVNPTQVLINEINKKYKSWLNTNCTKIKYANVYEVSSKYVDENFPKLEEIIRKANENGMMNKDTLHIILNYGVNYCSRDIEVETKAINYLEEHLQYNDGRVINSKESKDYKLKTKINVPLLLKNVKMMAPLLRRLCYESSDAGDYLCNYLMYKSIEFSYLYENVLATFVHIPPENIISLEKNVDFLKNVIKAFEKMYVN